MGETAKIALQLMTVKDYVAEHGISAALKKMEQLGIRYAEMSKIPPNDALFYEIAEVQKECGMRVVAYTGLIDIPIAESYTPRPVGEYLSDDYADIVRHAKIIGAEYIRTNMMPCVMRESQDTLKYTIEKMNEYGRRLYEDGLKYYYHTHHFEFARMNGEFILDTLLNYTDPRYVGIELDVHWAHRGGVDPVACIKKIKGRCELLHLKDYRIHNSRENLSGTERKRFASIELAEIGDGNLNFHDIIETGKACGSIYMIIEQDETYDRECFDSVALSAENIRKMGYGDLF